MKNMEQNEQTTGQLEKVIIKFYKKFRKHRNKILQDINNFLINALKCLHELNSTVNERESVTSTILPKIYEHLNRLIKSLCLIHALYGYPGESGDNPEGKSWIV